MDKLESAAAKSSDGERRATYQDIIDAPPHMVAEIVDGVLYTFPRPAPRHAYTYSGLGGIIIPPFHFGRGGPGGWWILNEPELHFGDDVLVPDIAGWRRARMASLPEEAYFTLAPDWVCEILSKSTRKFDLKAKRGVYAREGVEYLWFVDPVQRYLEARRLVNSQWVLIDRLHDDAQVCLPPFEEIRFDLSDLWVPPAALHRETPPQKAAAENETEII